MLDHCGNSNLDFNDLRVVVFDEADQLVDMGFFPSIQKICSYFPKTNLQHVLFSATLPQLALKLIRCTFTRDAQTVHVDTLSSSEVNINSQVKQYYHEYNHYNDLFPALISIVNNHCQTFKSNYKVIVFCSTARFAQFLSHLLSYIGISTLCICSRMSQNKRISNADGFKSAEKSILISSDVSARGIHYPDISLIIQIGMASSTEMYIHRLGRTARAGKQGECIVLLHNHSCDDYLKQLERDQIYLKSYYVAPSDQFKLNIMEQVRTFASERLDVVEKAWR